VSLKARLNRLEADVAWMTGEGHARYLGLLLETLRMQDLIFPEYERRRVAAAEAAKPRPPAKPVLRIVPPAPRDDVKSVEAPPDPAPPGPAPPAELPPPEPPPVQTFDIPEHMQIRPTRWRIRGPQDYDWDANTGPPEDDDDDPSS
jgi:hypothetical protein